MRDDERVAGRSEERDELDRGIDAALRSYTEPPETTEPRVAFARVMEQARAERPARWIRWWMWSAAGAAACLLAVVIAIGAMWAPRTPQIAWSPKTPEVAAVPEKPAGAQSARSFTAQAGALPHNRGQNIARAAPPRRTPLPKLAVFPTPRPLSPEEQALVAFAQHGPPAVQRAVLEDQKHWDDPIIVAGLRNRSLESGSQQDR
ncbi:MAG: hypothetical protein WBW84_22615 [Acidobacteriaceae bacterium]